MILITLVIAFALIFLSGFHWCAFKIEQIEQRPTAYKFAIYSVLCGLLGLYNMISIIGQAAS